MIKEISVAGIKLNNYSVLENLTQISKNLEANVFTIIEQVTMKTILLAKEDESVRESIESADVTVISETDILEAVGQATVLRKAEIERKEFFHQLMRSLERNGYTVYILGAVEKETLQMKERIQKKFPRMKIVGCKNLEEVVGAEIGIVNDINVIAPDVILSILPSPKQERFLKEHKSMFLAKIWYGLGAWNQETHRNGIADMIKEFICKNTFKRFIREECSSEETI